MKIQCNVCEVAEATVLCCADEAALCCACDEKVHAANKLASKHQRVSLSNSNSQMPICDICQETVGYFFCLEDRALLCRNCDVAIHTVNTLVSLHQRFLLTGVKVGLEAADLGALSSTGMSHTAEKISNAEKSYSLPGKSVPVPTTSQYNTDVPVKASAAADFPSSNLCFAGGSSAESIQQWQFDDFLGLNDFGPSYNFMDNDSSKADSDKLGDTVELDAEDCLGQVPDSSWAVPEISSPPTTSGLCWSKSHHQQRQIDAAASVPDVYSPMPNIYSCHHSTTSLERRR